MMQGYKWLLLLGGFMLITNYAESTALRTTDKNLQYMAYAGYIFARFSERRNHDFQQVICIWCPFRPTIGYHHIWPHNFHQILQTDRLQQ